jgi:predicted  nucleic acid-binding Zn-ribbon protein
MEMESLISGTIAGAGSFRCERCGYVLTLAASDPLSHCPGCGGHDFVRASLFSAGKMPIHDHTPHPTEAEHALWLSETREHLDHAGEYVAFEEDGETTIVPLTHEWTRVGRSLAADIRFDDPTVSRRHALIVRQADGVRVLDDRSLNGVFVNGERVEWKSVHDGDEIVIGRYRLTFLNYVPHLQEARSALAT